jgi:hypothetical protein
MLPSGCLNERAALPRVRLVAGCRLPWSGFAIQKDVCSTGAAEAAYSACSQATLERVLAIAIGQGTNWLDSPEKPALLKALVWTSGRGADRKLD